MARTSYRIWLAITGGIMFLVKERWKLWICPTYLYRNPAWRDVNCIWHGIFCLDISYTCASYLYFTLIELLVIVHLQIYLLSCVAHSTIVWSAGEPRLRLIVWACSETRFLLKKSLMIKFLKVICFKWLLTYFLVEVNFGKGNFIWRLILKIYIIRQFLICWFGFCYNYFDHYIDWNSHVLLDFCMTRWLSHVSQSIGWEVITASGPPSKLCYDFGMKNWSQRCYKQEEVGKKDWRC